MVQFENWTKANKFDFPKEFEAEIQDYLNQLPSIAVEDLDVGKQLKYAEDLEERTFANAFNSMQEIS